MDTFAEPYTLPGDELSLPDVRAQIKALEDEHRAAGVALSGRVVHVCHYLPVDGRLKSRAGVPTPPTTPPPTSIEAAEAEGGAEVLERPAQPKDGDDDGKLWVLAPRLGHSAMYSGIRSLSATHDQLLVGWTGGISTTVPGERIPAASIDADERAALQDALDEYAKKEAQEGEGQGHGPGTMRYVPVWLEDKVAHGHYDEYCKETLWPLFHYLLWQDVATELPSSSSPTSAYASYAAASAAYADAVAAHLRPGDIVWVHDYHLLLVPGLLRKARPDAVVGLFVHTPFPSSEVYRCLPRRKEILDGMLGANLVCFQTYSYTRHFLSTCVRVCGYEITSRGVDRDGHVTAIMHCPVGVDAERVARDTLRPGIAPKLAALRALYEGKKIIVGRDKLDVVKGVVQKLQAFARLLAEYPQWVGNVVLIQVTSPALNDSPRLERQVSELVASINGEFGSLDFIPVHHYHQTLKKDEFYALLSVADLGVITPLRDGMNTTSMEFVIAQDRTQKSPLVISEFMGISKFMDRALNVNPWNLGDMAAAMHRGLTMSTAEKAERHAALYKGVTTHTSHTWAAVLVKSLLGQINSQGVARSTPALPRAHFLSAYASSKKRLFLFDYDGTLAPIVRVPSMAVPSDGALRALDGLTRDPKNLVYIISGRDQAFLEEHLGRFERLGMSAEHGGFMREPGSKTWVNLTESLDMSWMGEVEEIFRYYTERTTGSHVELKKSSITWHYRSSDPEWGAFQCRQCQDLLENNLAHKRPIEVLVGKKNLEVRPVTVNKGQIVQRILYRAPDADFVFCAGDDKTDEDMFRALALFPGGSGAGGIGPGATLEAPMSVRVLEEGAPPVKLAIKPENVFTTAVGHHTKRTHASWHVLSPEDIIQQMLNLVEGATEGADAGDEQKSNM